MDINKLANDIFNIVKNFKIKSLNHCLTRLRIEFESNTPDKDLIKKTPNVIGVIQSGNQYQIILGPGIVDEVYKRLNSLLNTVNNSSPISDASPVASSNTIPKSFAAIKEKKIISQTIARFAKIFSQLIPAFVGAGIIAGIACIIQVSCGLTTKSDSWTHQQWIANEWYGFFQICLTVWGSAFLIIVGWKFCETFGGKPYLGGVIGAMFTPLAGAAFAALYHADPNGTTGTFLGIVIKHIHLNWLTSGLANVVTDHQDVNYGNYVVGAPVGSMFGLILSCSAAIWIEKFFNKIIHRHVNFVIVPILVLLTILILNIFLVFPLSGYIIYGLYQLFYYATQGQAAPFGDMVLAFGFLFLLMFGLQSALIPIYVTLLSEGIKLNTIYPLLGMGGAAQIGAAIALMLIAKKGSNFRKTIKPSIISAFLGIDEPLLYGMNLPRIVPLFTSAIGAAIAGFFIGGMQAWAGINMGVEIVYGVDGIWGLFTVTSETGGNIWLSKMVYGLGFLIAIGSGAILTIVGYRVFKNHKKINWDLS